MPKTFVAPPTLPGLYRRRGPVGGPWSPIWAWPSAAVPKRASEELRPRSLDDLSRRLWDGPRRTPAPNGRDASFSTRSGGVRVLRCRGVGRLSDRDNLSPVHPDEDPFGDGSAPRPIRAPTPCVGTPLQPLRGHLGRWTTRSIGTSRRPSATRWAMRAFRDRYPPPPATAPLARALCRSWRPLWVGFAAHGAVPPIIAAAYQGRSSGAASTTSSEAVQPHPARTLFPPLGRLRRGRPDRPGPPSGLRPARPPGRRGAGGLRAARRLRGGVPGGDGPQRSPARLRRRPRNLGRRPPRRRPQAWPPAGQGRAAPCVRAALQCAGDPLGPEFPAAEAPVFFRLPRGGGLVRQGLRTTEGRPYRVGREPVSLGRDRVLRPLGYPRGRRLPGGGPRAIARA